MQRTSQLWLFLLLLTMTWHCSICLAQPVVVQPIRPTPQPEKPFDIDDWTPRPATGKAEPWEKMRDPDWDDARFQSMNTGPFQNATFRVPYGNQQQLVYKGMGVKFPEANAAVVFDRATLRLAAGWTGGTWQHSIRRFGLLNTPIPAANSRTQFSMASTSGWLNRQGKTVPIPAATAPIEAKEGRYLGHYLHNQQIVWHYEIQGTRIYDTIRAVNKNGTEGFVRTLNVAAHPQKLTLRLDDRRSLPLAPSEKPQSVFVTYGKLPDASGDDIPSLIQPGPLRWGQPIVTKLVRGAADGPFAVDTLTIPYENDFKALFFCTGVDFLPDGRIAISTCHGDVWLAKIDEEKSTVAWQRYATGLYQPLGLKVIDGQVIVLERGQITRLHDNNNDGEADYYECVSNNWHTGNGEHSYDTCLETDPDGNFYFFKTGDTNTPTGGCLLKVSKDGSKTEIFSTGFRHPIGLGMSPTGVVTGADQEGNWMPATRIDEYKSGGFYGDMRAHHRQTPPTIYDGPLCWLPREIDNSAGGQVWVPENTFGPLAGKPLHLSYGRCRPYVLLRQELLNGTVQGGVAGLPISFLSGSCRGRFHPTDGHLYVAGLNGWQTAAKADGSLQRVRYTGKPIGTVVQHEIRQDGVLLKFSEPLDKASATNPANYRGAWWNYRWNNSYGSKRWKVSNPNVEGQDELKIAEVTLLDEQTVFVKLEGGVKPVMQLQLGYNIQSNKTDSITGSVFLTIHDVK